VSDESITFLILGAVVAAFVWDALPVAVVAIGVALSLWATDVLTLEQSLAGFGDPSVLVTVAPGKGGLGTFAPLLDEAGNSVRGQLAARFLSRALGLDLFA
jgi:hypothetical protein